MNVNLIFLYAEKYQQALCRLTKSNRTYNFKKYTQRNMVENWVCLCFFICKSNADQFILTAISNKQIAYIINTTTKQDSSRYSYYFHNFKYFISSNIILFWTKTLNDRNTSLHCVATMLLMNLMMTIHGRKI